MPQTKRTAPKRKIDAAPVQDTFGRLQPQALDLEKAVLGALLLEKDAYYVVSEILKPKSFYDPKHQIIYEAIQQLNIEQTPPDLLTLTEKLTATQQLEEVGGPAYLAQLTMGMSSSAHIEFHARIIAQKATARELIGYTGRIQDLAFDPTSDIDLLMQEAEGSLFELSQNNLKKDYSQIDPVINDSIAMIRVAAARPDGMSGIPSLYTHLDKMTAGWQNSDLVILAARPAMGKTAFALSMARNIAIEQSIPLAFFSLEMSKVQLMNRLISNICEIKSEKIRNGDLANYEWAQLDSRIKDVYGKPLYLDDTPSLSVFELRTKARRLVREHGVRIIMIDYLQLMNASGMKFVGRQEEVSIISRSLKGLAKELNIPILALSQLNRDTEKRTGSGQPGNTDNEAKRPQLSDLRESGAIEQDADMVLFIHRPEYYRIYKDSQNRDLRGMAEIIIAKHRNGAVGDVLLSFKGEYTRFENPDAGFSIPLPGETTPIARPSAPDPTADDGGFPDTPPPMADPFGYQSQGSAPF